MAQGLLCAQCAEEIDFSCSELAASERVWPVCSNECFDSVFAQKTLEGFALTDHPKRYLFQSRCGCDVFYTMACGDGDTYGIALYVI